MQHRPGRDSRREKIHQSGKPPCVVRPHTVADWSLFNPETTLGHTTVCLTQSKKLATAPNHFLELLVPSMAVSAVLAAFRLHSLVLFGCASQAQPTSTGKHLEATRFLR
jgi:hypothetical protein